MRKLKNEELGRKSIEELQNEAKNPLVVVLDNVRSMNNIGSVFRTADAFLIEKIILCGITATPPHRDIQKTALGATESVEWHYAESTIMAVKQLKDLNYKVYAIEQAEGAVYLQNFVPLKSEKYALVFGNEVEGVDADCVKLCNGCIEIPQFGHKHSLNISVSAGVVLWDMVSKLCFEKI